jgi:hypothetical protein
LSINSADFIDFIDSVEGVEGVDGELGIESSLRLGRGRG